MRRHVLHCQTVIVKLNFAVFAWLNKGHIKIKKGAPKYTLKRMCMHGVLRACSSSIYTSSWSLPWRSILYMCRPISSLVVAQWTHRRLQMFAQSLCWQHKGENPIRKKDRKRKPQWDLSRQIYWKETKKVMTGICSAFSYLKILVHLLQLFHGVLNISLQRHAALICPPLRLPEQIHLLL